MTGVYLEVDGQPVPVRTCSWLLVAPCGCVSGITVADPRVDGPITTAEAALASFTPNKEMLRRDLVAGWTARLSGNPRAAVDEMVGPNGCPHTPTWGVEPAPQLEGWVWASCRKSPRSHLVKTREDGEYWRTAPALCGPEHHGWDVQQWTVHEVPTCRRCEIKARELTAANGGVS